jgi:hypothetical protein
MAFSSGQEDIEYPFFVKSIMYASLPARVILIIKIIILESKDGVKNKNVGVDGGGREWGPSARVFARAVFAFGRETGTP